MGVNNLAYIDYYEVFFLKRNKTNGNIDEDYSATGSAGLGETLAVSVYPDVNYEVLLLAGQYKTRTLMASSYNKAVPIVSGKINRVDLTLEYVKSNPLADFEFNYYGGTVDTKPVTTPATYYELPPVKNITISTAGAGYAVGARLIGTGAGGDLAAVLRVTGVDGSGGITDIAVENKGRFASATQSISWAVIGSGSNADFTLGLVAQTDNIPDTIPWLSYINDGTNNLKFKIKTDGLTPLIDAGGTAGSGSTNFELAKAELKLVPYSGDTFVPVSDETTAYGASFILDATTGATVYTAYISLEYAFPNANLPSPDTNAYGLLYYQLQYRAFGGDSGSTWTIRNGVGLAELDKGVLSSGGGLLVKIGNPGKFTPKVNVQVIP
jgi:hypothetical protein